MGYIRILLAMVVAIGHTQSSIPGQPFDAFIFMCGPIIAVKLFFVISGFYMAVVYGNYRCGSHFLASRAIRLWPAYWLTLLGGLCVALLLRTPHVGPYLSFSGWLHLSLPQMFLFAFSEFSFFGIDAALFTCTSLDEAGRFVFSLLPAPDCPQGMEYGISHYAIPPAWTLALEAYFYLMVPWLYHWRTRYLVALAAASIALNLGLAQAGLYYIPWNRSFFPAELWLFVIGFLAFRHRAWFEGKVGVVCAACALVLFGFYQNLGFDWYKPGLLLIVQIFIFALALPNMFRIGARLPGERFAGDLSYPIYISHAVVMSTVLALQVYVHFSTVVAWALGNAFAVFGGALLLYYATLPVEHLRRRLKARRFCHA